MGAEIKGALARRKQTRHYLRENAGISPIRLRANNYSKLGLLQTLSSKKRGGKKDKLIEGEVDWRLAPQGMAEMITTERYGTGIVHASHESE
ncbi:hypothetical protein RRG08_002743 [Elysia crispata]|uniref:Uncharacterized protein n=1 Tax=Elysia crispata TaxID=231223 RepID=A0AAE0XTZ5_9GAST|nr:hypothetical protein RRG08_002743 [Elysia crispata]